MCLKGTQVNNAFASLRHQRRLDCSGISVLALRFLCEADPEPFARLLDNLLCSSASLQSLEIVAYAKGKGTNRPTVEELRCIVPLPSILQVADVLLAAEINDFVNAVLPCPDCCFEGAVKFTQPLDIAHGLSLGLERGLDDHSNLGIAQADIRQYYDSLNVLQLALWLHHEGLSKAWAAAIVRMQMLPALTLCTGDCKSTVAVRSNGSLTGSRVAGALGRIPVMSVVSQRSFLWKALGFKLEDSALAVCTYVDNLYSIAHTPADAIAILEDFELHLQLNWGLTIKPSSRAVFVPRRLDIAEDHDMEKWPVRSHFPVLGHLLDAAGSSWPCWQNTKRNMWRAFFSNCTGTLVKDLPASTRERLMGRCVLPICDFRSSRWSFHASLAADLDRQQRKMTSILARIPRCADEADAVYFRRRHRQISSHCKSQGLWSLRHAARVCAWNAHLHRPQNARSWAARLLHWHGRDWLASQRLAQGTPSLGGRTGTRAGPGCPCPRWHDGVVAAETVLAAVI